MILLGLYVFSLARTSNDGYAQTKKTINHERAKMVAQSGLAHATALLFQNSFPERWYKQNPGAYGFWGTLEGSVGAGSEKGTYKVVGEDIANELPPEWKGNAPDARAARLENLKYNRIDLFSEGVYQGTRVILYQSLILHPEEPVYSYDKTDAAGMVTYENVEVR